MSALFPPSSSARSSFPTASSSRRCASTAPTTAAPTNWHLGHLGMLANSGAGLVIVEATHVERHGRITHGCMGLYSDDNEAAMARVHRALPAHRHRQARHPDRACRPQGLRAAAVGGRRCAAGRRRSVADDRAVADSVRAELARAARRDAGRHRAGARGVRQFGEARGADRLRRHRAALRARLSRAFVPVAGVQPAHRPVRRLAGEPHAVRPARSRRRCATAVPKSDRARRPHHRQRLARRRALDRTTR